MEWLPYLSLLTPVAVAVAGWAVKGRMDDRAELAAFKVHVAENYARRSSLESVERKILDAIKDLGARIDRLAEKS